MQEYLANLKYLQHLRETSACEKALEAPILKSPLCMLLRSTFARALTFQNVSCSCCAQT